MEDIYIKIRVDRSRGLVITHRLPRTHRTYIPPWVKYLPHSLTSPTPKNTTHAPSWLELLVYRDQLQNRYLVYAYKIMEVYYQGAARNVDFSIRVPEKTGVLKNISTGQPEEYQRQGERINWSADRIDDFAMYTLEISG